MTRDIGIDAWNIEGNRVHQDKSIATIYFPLLDSYEFI